MDLKTVEHEALRLSPEDRAKLARLCGIGSFWVKIAEVAG